MKYLSWSATTFGGSAGRVACPRLGVDRFLTSWFARLPTNARTFLLIYSAKTARMGKAFARGSSPARNRSEPRIRQAADPPAGKSSQKGCRRAATDPRSSYRAPPRPWSDASDERQGWRGRSGRDRRSRTHSRAAEARRRSGTAHTRQLPWRKSPAAQRGSSGKAVSPLGLNRLSSAASFSWILAGVRLWQICSSPVITKTGLDIHSYICNAGFGLLHYSARPFFSASSTRSTSFSYAVGVSNLGSNMKVSFPP